VFVAHEMNVPVAVYAISAGPLTKEAARASVRAALNAAAIVTVRDRQGYRVLEDVGITHEVHLTADPALLITSWTA
jgi:polysaccharide pyruvyl transferase WcaK-like protein